MRRAVLLCLSIGAAIPTGEALACATCLCGDPTITTMGAEKPFSGRLRGSVDWLRRGETVGVEGVNRQEVDEQRITASVSYAPSPDWIFAVSVPFVDKEVRRFNLSRETASGVGDADLSARWYLGNTREHLWGVQFGLRVPTSSEQKSNGAAVDFDAQPGAGSTIPSLGVWYGNYRNPDFFYTSAVWQRAIDNGYQGYRMGDVALVTGHAQRGLWGQHLALSFSIDGRWKDYDTYFGVRDDDSGGLLVMATPGVSWTPVMDLIFNVSYQIPAFEHLNGEQEEDPSLRIGVTYDF